MCIMLGKGEWTKEEDAQLIELHDLLGNKWKVISERLVGRYVCIGLRVWAKRP
jgi:hypothetical protein